MVKAQAEILGQVAEEIQVYVAAWDPEHPLDLIQPESILPAHCSFVPLKASQSLSL